MFPKWLRLAVFARGERLNDIPPDLYELGQPKNGKVPEAVAPPLWRIRTSTQEALTLTQNCTIKKRKL